ncbi:hypothetical protein SETIT_8G217000v2 [Setaria italica]|uniref:Protein kinase domain-containing protein n=1 Tax=Setaria italica TaxID=4555 RepID=A0A368SAI4_SETIT|nr:hypothetical protein SETIT_8G217000v2 [Setaria italica]
MANLVKEVIDVGSEIKTLLEKFNNLECCNICNFMETLCKDLRMLPEVPLIRDNQSMKDTMESLKSVLGRMATEAKKCQKNRAALKAFKADDIARDLNVLRLEIIQNILWLKDIAGRTTYSLLDRKINQKSNKLEKILDAIKSLLVPLEHKVEQPVQTTNSTDNASNKNKNQTKKSVYNWSELDAAIASSNHEKVEGSSSFVYKDVLHNNKAVAIKKFKEFNDSNKKRFIKELNIISKLQHGNIVEHLGHCYQNREILVQTDSDFDFQIRQHLAFVSGYISNQSLDKVIKGDEHVDWPNLFGIIQGIAKGICYLHMKRVVHMDLQPKDILLGKGWTPKINKFNKAELILLKEPPFCFDTAKGTYVAPELSLDGGMCETLSLAWAPKIMEPTKCDVYSFGIILLETMSVVWKKCRGPPSKEIREQWAKRLEKRDLFDQQLVADDSNRVLALRCVLVGLICCLREPARRLSMEEVVVRIGGPRTEVVPAAAPSSSSAAQAIPRQ